MSSNDAQGGWLVANGGGFICAYTFSSADLSGMDVNCFGANLYGCTVPKGLHFQKH
jgi:hypothetical protein